MQATSSKNSVGSFFRKNFRLFYTKMTQGVSLETVQKFPEHVVHDKQSTIHA